MRSGHAVSRTSKKEPGEVSIVAVVALVVVPLVLLLWDLFARQGAVQERLSAPEELRRERAARREQVHRRAA